MTIKEVCERADASVGTVYHHFPRGLPDLEAVLYLETLADYQAGLLDELQCHRSAESGVKAVVLFHLEWIASNLSRAHFLLYFSPDWLTSEQAGNLREMNERFVRAAEAWRESYLENGQMRRRSPVLYGPLILGPAQQFGSLLIASGGDEDDVTSAVRAEGPELAEAAWSLVKGEQG
jgi:AcrR family transcriptional regulator